MVVATVGPVAFAFLGAAVAAAAVPLALGVVRRVRRVRLLALRRSHADAEQHVPGAGSGT